MKIVRRIRTACLCLVIGAILLTSLLCGGLVLLVREARGQEGASPVDVVLVVDHSNSMWEMGGIGSDPKLLRLDAVRLFISYLGVDTPVGDNRLGVVTFGSESRLPVPLTPLGDDAQRAAVARALDDPQRMGWTNVKAALELAYAELFASGRHDPGHRPAVILLSDGKPELPELQTPAARETYVAELRELVRAFRQQDCPIFTIALTNRATAADQEIQTTYRNLWQEIAASTPPAEYHEAATAADLLRIYHDVVVALVGGEAEPPVIEREIAGKVIERVQVEEGLAQVTFVVLKSEPALSAQITRPNGLPVRPGDADTRYAGRPGESKEEVWAMRRPQEGEWSVEIEGYGQVVVWKDETAAQDAEGREKSRAAVRLHAPAPYYPQWEPVRVAATILDEEGRAVMGPGMEVSADLRRAGFTEETAHLFDDGRGGDERAGDGVYSGSLPGLKKGDYDLRVTALTAQTTLARLDRRLTVVPLPRLSLVAPSPGAVYTTGQTITLLAGVDVESTPVAAADLDDESTHSAEVCDERGEGRPVGLTWITSTLRGAIPPLEAGVYTATARLRGRTREDLPYEAESSTSFTVVAPPRGRPWGGIIGGGAGLLALVVLWKTLRKRSLLPVEGALLVLAAPPGRVPGERIDLSRLRRSEVLLGPKRGDRVFLAGGEGGAFRAAIRAVRGVDGEIEMELRPLLGEICANGRPLSESHSLRDGDIVALGGYRLRYEDLHRRRAGV